ncbi:hypothetical protein Barb7_03240 [Bacteroidales bacterium Barb7]|nr:hypothetical protein Barb7_03240 [Bacteroidales bacterium Barb7]
MIKVKKVWFSNEQIYILTETGRTGSLPLKSFHRLYNATDEQRENFTLSPFGIHWQELDEDLCFEGFLNIND